MQILLQRGWSALMSLTLLVALAWLTSGISHAQTLLIDRVVAVDDEPTADRFPEQAAQRNVTLPDSWSVTRGHRSTDVWYRARFDRPENLQNSPAALLIERACSNAVVVLNGELIHKEGSMAPPLARRCRHPIHVQLPSASLLASGNVLDIRLAGHALEQVASDERAAELSAVRLGPADVIATAARKQAWWGHELPLIASFVYGVLGLLLIMLGRVDRRDSHLSSFGVAMLCMAVIEARHWWTHIPLPHRWVEGALLTVVALLAMSSVRFFLRYAGWRSRFIETALLAQCLLVPLSVAFAGPLSLHTLASWWMVLFMVEALIALCIYLWTMWHRNRNQLYIMTALSVPMILFTTWQAMIQQDVHANVPQAWAQAGMMVLAVLLGMRLVQQFGRELQLSEASRRMTEIKVREATLEIERNFAQMAELRVEQVTAQERKRIAGDLHDDLGAKLLTIVHTSEDERISTLAREALEEMRLSVRGLTGKPMKLTDALGDWRAEFVQRLSQTGLEADWESPDGESTSQRLSARAYVQTTRILREAVNNIIKHSGASRCVVTVKLNRGDFEIAIQDNGKGMPTDADGRLDRGHGLANMKQRAKQLHGQCLVESAPGSGTVIRLTLPLDRQLEPV